MFPMAHGPRWIHALGRANPMAYAVDGVRRALYGGAAPGASSASAAVELGVVAAFAVVAVLAAALVCNRRGDKP
jgi:hypothetical protein